MRSQRLPDTAPCLAGSDENLPIDDQSFDAAMAVCTVHHWRDPIAGLREMRRVARRVVVFAGDTSDPGQFWLTRDYLPEFAAFESLQSLGLADRAGPRDRSPDGTGAHPVGLR
jgi:ubiquinone/menaquinone biosynthesis C-methylase UbiE